MHKHISNYDQLNAIELEQFITLLKKENRSESTIEAYLTDLEQFFNFLNDKNYFEVLEADILRYIKKIREDYTQSTVYRKVQNIKSFFRYLYINKKIDSFIAENVKSGRQNTHIPEILSEEEIYYILENCDMGEKGKRDYLIIKILYETGILISDLLQLKTKDINDYKFITYGSSKKSHVITLGKELASSIKEYIDTVWRNNYANDAGILFPGLSRQNFAARLKKYAAKAGINRSIYPNMLRNTLAVNLLDNGQNIREIKDRLNYVNISKSGIYTIRNKNEIKEIYDKIAIGDWNVPEDFDNLDNSYDEIESLLKNKKIVDAYSVLKERDELEARYLFVLVNILLKKYKKASEIMEELNPNSVSVVNLDIFYETKGLCYFEQNNYLEASKNFIKSLEINPTNFYSKYNLTMIYLLKKDFENAEKRLVELLEVEPENDILKENLRLLREKNKIQSDSPCGGLSLFLVN